MIDDFERAAVWRCPDCSIWLPVYVHLSTPPRVTFLQKRSDSILVLLFHRSILVLSTLGNFPTPRNWAEVGSLLELTQIAGALVNIDGCPLACCHWGVGDRAKPNLRGFVKIQAMLLIVCQREFILGVVFVGTLAKKRLS